MDRDELNPQDLARWRQVRPLAQPCQPAMTPDAQGPIDPLDLAAYVEGTADAELVERLERRMLADAALVDAVLELRRLQAQELAELSPHAVTRALALVVDEKETSVPASAPVTAQDTTSASPTWPVHTRTTGRPTPGLGAWALGWRWTVAAAVVLLACVLGYTSGQSTWAFAQAPQAASAGHGLGGLLTGSGGGGGGGDLFTSLGNASATAGADGASAPEGGTP